MDIDPHLINEFACSPVHPALIIVGVITPKKFSVCQFGTVGDEYKNGSDPVSIPSPSPSPSGLSKTQNPPHPQPSNPDGSIYTFPFAHRSPSHQNPPISAFCPYLHSMICTIMFLGTYRRQHRIQ